MIYFNCDYLEGGHPKILEKMLSTNMEQLTGYSTDHYCDSARERIRQACGCPDADVHFLVGGTQTNLTAIASTLRPYLGNRSQGPADSLRGWKNHRRPGP